MHPLSAQFLFFLGVLAGANRQAVQDLLDQGTWILPVCAVILILADYLAQMKFVIHHFDQKQYVGPARIGSLVAVLAILGRYVRQPDVGRPVGLVEACGRHALATFVISTVGALILGRLANSMEVSRAGFAVLVTLNATLLPDGRPPVAAPGKAGCV